MTWLDWLSALMRWAHVIAAITWIGDSLLFMWIDSHLSPDPQSRKDVDGITWLLHSGGYYHLEKRWLIPGQLPPRLRWFWLEATATWVSGFLLLFLVYYWNAAAFLVDPGTSLLTPGQAVAAGLGMLVVGWLIYDGLWRSPLADWPGVALGLSGVLLLAVIYLATQAFSARAAFLHIGSMLGTVMAANVWIHIIIPQRQMVAAAREGREIDYSLGEHAKTRSTHNTYLTFPVIFLMISNHFPGVYAHRWNGIILAMLIVFGAGIRHLMHVGVRPARGAAAATLASAAALVILTLPQTPRPSESSTPGAGAPPFVEVRAVIVQRCTACHSETPTDPTFAAAAGGVRFDTPQQIKARADRIRVRAVEQRTMPLANKTGMPDDERAILGRWVDAGAPLR